MNTHNYFFSGKKDVGYWVKQSKKEIIIKQLKRYRIQVTLLKQPCIYDSVIQHTNNYTMIYSSALHDMKILKAHGVAICLDPIATKIEKDSKNE